MSMTYRTEVFPFSAIIGQEDMKLALILNAVNPAIGGALIRGEKGTAKSTAVRALASLLPEIEVVKGCPYSCDPAHEAGLCDTCRSTAESGAMLMYARRKIRVVDRPLNATEDMVLGSIDFSFAVKSGRRRFHPGLLARANRGIVYIDEVNLLDDHLVDIILDAASGGANTVEREGISFRHPARFILVGTMNPEEGELRPQLLDRFGLCVQISGEQEPGKRAALMELREHFDVNPYEFRSGYTEKDSVIAGRIAHAGEIIGGVTVSARIRTLITNLCVDNNVAGHRADIVMERAATALAAYEDRLKVTVEDVARVAQMALLHRQREAAPPPPPPEEHEHEHDHDHDHEHEQQENPEEQQDKNDQDNRTNDQPLEWEEIKQEQQSETQDADEPEPQIEMENAQEKVFEIGEPFKVRKIAHDRDRQLRRGSGKRSRTRTSQKQGRYVKSTMRRTTGDFALDATLRAAAPHQKQRRGTTGLAVSIKDHDIREKVREKRVGNFLLFVVDGSGSMGARARMVASKGAVLSLLIDAYQKRDKVAMIVFRKDQAETVLPPTPSIELAGKLLEELPVGGRTPLSEALAKASDLLDIHLLKEPTSRPVCIFVTDGKANVAVGESNPREEVLSFAARMTGESRIKYIVVDTEGTGIVNFGLAAKLASALGADYFKIEDLKADELVNIARSVT